MKQEALFRKLGNILTELNEQYQFLSQNPEQLSELELELFLANANFLADHIQIIKKLNLVHVAAVADKATPAIEEPIVVEVSDELKDVQQVEAITFGTAGETQDEIVAPLTPAFEGEEQEALAEGKEEVFKFDITPPQTFEFLLNKDSFNEDDKFDFEEKTADQLFDRPLSEEEAFILEQKKKVKENLIRDPEILEEDEIGPEPFLVHHEEELEVEVTDEAAAPTPIIEPTARQNETPAVEATKVTVETTKVEMETDYKPTLNDILAGSNTGSRNETSGAVVSDLRSAINLNDKLLYIKDLFNGYNLAYAEAIDIANKMPNFDAADNFFQKNYAVKNNWAEKQATVDKFYLLLNRRFRD